ncbi:Ubiquinone biosynthesis protein COQ7 -like protein [Trichinella papuae]|uniref:Ubiquinone biosynthesis protein COQ7-like protein n=1 Tax=Trichinella papuae TaxID=268474 RepID=A0A0V1N9Q8_9BILA|nr:Ubiquinone biosynthesis protein COQ7 -like protein [Trichinella papuae]
MWIKIVRGFCTETNRQRMLDRIIRVDHAGELGAARIYAGQLFVLGQRPLAMTLQKLHNNIITTTIEHQWMVIWES